MPKSPEQFDFSKLEDQQKFDKLSKDKQDGIINESQEEAQKINEEIEKKEITPDVWQRLVKEIEFFKEDKNRWGVAMRAEKIKILNPEMAINLEQESWFWKETKEVIEKHKKEKKWGAFADEGARAKILDPKIDLNLSEQDRQEITEYLKEMKEGAKKAHREFGYGLDGYGEWYSYALLAARLKIINPELDFGLDKKTWKNMKKDLEKCRKTKRELFGDRDPNWFVFIKYAEAMKILDPKLDFSSDKKFWEWSKKYLSESKGRKDEYGNWEFLNQSTKMKILASPEVKIPSTGGLEVM